MEALLTVRKLRVDYEDVTAVDDVSFSIEAGTVYGLIGPNGAGKTTLMRVIATLLEPTHGSVRVAGIDVLDQPREALRHIGFMPDLPPIYEDLTVREFLDLFASASGIVRAQRPGRIADLLERVRLTEKRDQLAGGLSRGMKQRLFLARTLLHEPDLLVLDEPASGLDPHARVELRDIVRDLGQAGRAVLVSSHILSELADFCTSVGVMEQGKLIASGRIEDVARRIAPGLPVEVRLLAPDDRLATVLGTWPGLRDLVVDGGRAVFRLDGPPEDAARLLASLVQQGLPVVEFHPREGNLEDLFLKISDGRVS